MGLQGLNSEVDSDTGILGGDGAWSLASGVVQTQLMMVQFEW